MKLRKHRDYSVDCCSERYALLQELSSIVEQAPDCIIRTDAEFNITYMNRAAEKLTGYTLAEVLGKKPDILSSRPADEALHDRDYQAIRQQGKTELEFVNRRKNGEEYIVKSSISPIFDDAGEVAGYVAFHQDITERRRVEAALRESEAHFEQAARQSRSFVWEVDAEGLYTSVSGIVEDIFGYRPEEIVGKLHFYDLHPPAEREKFKASALEVFHRRGVFHNLENQALTKTGDTLWLSTNGFPLLNEDGTLRGYRGSDIDVTELKIKEQELREREELYHALMIQSHDAIALLDAETLDLVEVNPRFEQLTGYRRPVDAMLEVLDLFDDSRENAQYFFQRLVRDGVLSSTIRPMRTRDGRRLYVERAASMVRVADRSYLLLNLRDITEEMIRRREMEQELALATQVQQALLSEIPQADEFAIETLFAPAGFVSGDVYHLEWQEPTRTLRGFLLDITGHGLASALQTAAVNVLLHEVMDLPEKLTVSEQLGWLNQRIFRYIDETSFAAAIAFEIDFARGRLCYAAAGMTDFLLNRERITTPGLFLGIDRKETYETSYLPFAAGDAVCFMTDGITDVLTAEENWGKVAARDICDRFRDKRQADRLQDDATAICIRATGRRRQGRDHDE